MTEGSLISCSAVRFNPIKERPCSARMRLCSKPIREADFRIQGQNSLRGPLAAQVGRLVPQVGRRGRQSGAQPPCRSPRTHVPGAAPGHPTGRSAETPPSPPCAQQSAGRPGLAPLRLGAGPRSLGFARQNLRAPRRLSPLYCAQRK